MHFSYPWLTHKRRGSQNVGLISLGSIDEKIPLILYTLLLSADITLSLYQNYHVPPSPSSDFLEEIKRILLNAEPKAIVFDLKVQDWPHFQNLKQSRKLAHALQEICSFRQISSSVVLSSGSQQLGNYIGLPYEILEAREVLEGTGPPDLVKFALEIGSDFLLLTKKAQHKMEANIFLKEKIVSGELSSRAGKILGTFSSCLDTKIKKRINSLIDGYLHHWVPEELLALKLKLLSSLPGSGFSLLKKHGDKISRGDEIAYIYLSGDQQKLWSDESFEKAFVVSDEPPDFRPFILEKSEMRFFQG
jgi:thymidine phosphorylase